MKEKDLAVVTGSTGFIGQHLIEALTRNDIRVLTVPHELLHQSYKLARYFDMHQPQYIFHLAAYGNMAYQSSDDSEIFKANLIGTYNLLEATRDVPYEAFINVSTSSIKLPHQTMYSATKAGAEMICQAFIDEYKKPIVSVRPYSVYGVGEAAYRLIPTIFRSCLKGVEMPLVFDAVHDWVYVDDVVHSMIDIALTGCDSRIFGAIEDCGTGIMHTNSQVVDEIVKITGKAANITPVDEMRSYDTNTWKADLPLPGMTSLHDGLVKYYESIKSK